MVYVLSKAGEPLMPTERHGKVKHLLRQGKAKVVRTKPFTIQLTYDSDTYTQPCKLGMDSGYQEIGVSVISNNELFSATITLLQGMVARLEKRSKHRRQRRNRLRHRQKRFDSRKRKEGWLAPSLQHKLDSHVRIVDLVKSILPITEITVEVASFDIQKLKNQGIEGKEYQQGEKFGFWNLREYILHRDNHICQNPACGSITDRLQLHHIGYWYGDMTDRPGNLVALCVECHIPANHNPGKLLHGWNPNLNSYKPETFMSTVRWRLVDMLGCDHTYGYITKSHRIDLGLEKSHVNDAFIIAGGTSEQRTAPLEFKQFRRNNRSLEKFYDAKYIDIRTGQKVSGQDLFSGRRTRNKNNNTENLRKYRGEKLSKGRRNIRTQRYFYQPGDLVKHNNEIFSVKGIVNYGNYVRLNGVTKDIKTSLVKPYCFMKGLCATT